MKVFDFIPLLIVISIGITGLIWGIKSPQGKKVIIKTPYGEYVYLLNNNRTINLKGLLGEYVIEIKDKKVYVLKTNCPDKLCKYKGKISKEGDCIICVPNKIIIKIENNKSEIDAITE